MDASLGGIAVQPTAVGIARQAVHDGPADATGLVDLKAEIIVGAGHGMVVLMDHKVRAARAACTALVQAGITRDAQSRDEGRCRAETRGESRRELGQMVRYLDGSGFDFGGGAGGGPGAGWCCRRRNGGRGRDVSGYGSSAVSNGS